MKKNTDEKQICFSHYPFMKKNTDEKQICF